MRELTSQGPDAYILKPQSPTLLNPKPCTLKPKEHPSVDIVGFTVLSEDGRSAEPWRAQPSALSVWAKGILLGGSWVVISGVVSRVTILITHIRGLITLLKATLKTP